MEMLAATAGANMAANAMRESSGRAGAEGLQK
jgi:hypothetical protein